MDDQKAFLAAEHAAELHGAELKKELGVGDLALAQGLYIVGLIWFGTAGKLGSSHALFWIPAVLLFYIPSGIVVVHLSREMPLEGGVYQWAKLRFGGAAGFLVAWNLWAYAVLTVSNMVSLTVINLAYAAGPAGAWIAESKPVVVVTGILMIGVLVWLAARGLSLGKWIHNAGGLTVVLIFTALLVFAIPRWTGGRSVVSPLAFSIPAVSLLNLNLLGKMAFGAFVGLDSAAIFSGECRDPDAARAIRRSVWLAAPSIAIFYILGTAFVLTFVSPNEMDLASPAMQALSRGAQEFGIAGFATPFLAALLFAHNLGVSSITYNAAIRLPMVAGWDHLFPAWFSRLHPRHKTPVGSVIFVGLASLAATILGNLGVHSQEAVQLLVSGSFICYALTYLVMFAIPLIAAGEKPAWSVRAAAASGFLMTLLFAVLSIFPVIELADAASFTFKVGGFVVAVNGAGALYYWAANKRRARRA